MYNLLRNGSGRQLLQNELAPMFGAGLVTELFFKWHSFTLECLGFLAQKSRKLNSLISK